MPASPPLTKHVGQAERTLQALLQTHLSRSELSFPEWTVLTFLSGPDRLGRDQLVEALDRGQIVQPDEAHVLIDAMTDKGLIAPVEAAMSLTDAGVEVFLPLRNAVGTITATLVRDISPDDLEATRRTLDTVTRRAAELLSSSAS
jgi:hypothetical protein